MRKNCILSLLAASTILISALAPSPVLAEGRMGESYQENYADQQYLFISVPSGENVADYLDERFDNTDWFGDGDNGTGTENDNAVNGTGPASAVQPDAGNPSQPEPVSQSAPGSSEFEISGNVLVKYRGNEASVSVPDNVAVIGSGAFAGNKSVMSVYLPDSVTEIEGNAFENCTNLQFIVISARSKLSTIGAYAFAGCLHLNISFAMDVENVSAKAFPPELVATPEPTKTPTPKPTPTMKATPVRPSTPLEILGPENGLAVPGSLRITLQPVSVYAREGERVSFIVVAEGNGSIHYQWMRSKDGVSWVKIENNSNAFENASTNVLSFTATAVRASYLFKCVVSDGVNKLESDIVSVTLDGQGAAPDPDAPDPWEEAGNPDPAEGQDAFPQIPADYRTDAAPYIQARQISKNSALVVWTAMQSAVGYELYRYSVTQNGKWAEDFVLLGTFTDTSYTDTNLDFDKYKYTYSVKAVLSAPQSGDPVTTDYSNPADVKAFSAPAEVTVWQESETSVRIFWSPSEFASSYMVTRSKNGGQFFILAQSLNALEYVDDNVDLTQNTYQYKVWAVFTVPGSDEPIYKASQPVKVEELFNIGKEIEINNVVYTITADGVVVTAYKGSAASLTIPSTIRNNKYTVIAIGPNVFWGNKTLKTITLPKTIRVIETGAFAYCGASIVIK